MNDTIKLTGTLLEATAGEYQGNPYISIKLRSKEVADNTILKYKVDPKRVSIDVLKESIDTEVTVLCEVLRGQNDLATLKVVGLG